MSDAVNHPSHYNAGAIEVIDAIEDWQLGFHLGNVVKYIARAEHKGNAVEDLKKASWYLERKIKQMEKQNEYRQTIRKSHGPAINKGRTGKSRVRGKGESPKRRGFRV